jgi:predicted small lipoprotein YifL
MKTCWAQYLLWLVIAVLGAGSALSACGQTGSLYLPDEPKKSQKASSPAKSSEPSASQEPSASKEPSANKEPPATSTDTKEPTP